MSLWRRSAGFTLLELLIVIMLMALISAALLPNFGGSFGFRIEDASREISRELELAAQSAIASGHPHRWQVNLDNQTFRLERLYEEWPEIDDELPTHAELLDLTPPQASLKEYRPLENKSGEWRALTSDEVRIDEIRLADERYAEDSVGIGFAPDGGADSAEIWLGDENGLGLRLRIIAFTGEVRVEEIPVE